MNTNMRQLRPPRRYIPTGQGLRRQRRGAVLVIMLIGISLLVGLVFFVFNLGDQINRRLSAQNTADSVAVSGAGWMARSMNTVAMDNVTITRMIALVVVLDSLPVAAEMTIAEMTGTQKLPDALGRYANPVAEGFTPYERDNFYRLGLAEIYLQMSPGEGTQLDVLEEMDGTFDQDNEFAQEGAYDIKRSTEWDSPSGRGYIWRAIVALDDFSQATADSAGRLAQDDAARFGLADGANAAFVSPILPKFPGKRTVFDDFGPPLMDYLRYGTDRRSGQKINEIVSSRLVDRLRLTQDTAMEARLIRVRGGAIPDCMFSHRLGPFARLYRWRDYWDLYEYSFEDRWGYSTYGPLEQLHRQVVRGFGQPGYYWGWWGGDWGEGQLDITRFAYHLRTLANVKLAYLFGLAAPVYVQYSDQWITDYPAAVEFMEKDRSRMADERTQNEENGTSNPVKSNVMTTRYYRVRVKSTVNPDTQLQHWMKLASWQEEEPTLTFTPRRWFSWQLEGRGPYSDPTAQPLRRWIYDIPGWSPIGNPMPYAQARSRSHSSHPQNRWIEMDNSQGAWYRKGVNRQVRYDRDLGLPERLTGRVDADGNPVLGPDGLPECVYYTIYHVEWRVFGGIEIRNEILLSNPAAGASQDDLPAPFLLDCSEGDYTFSHDEGIRRNRYTYLGIARWGGSAKVWNQRFYSGNPSGAITTVAQAELFNNKSWGLWTQDWQSQLVPVTRWSNWQERLTDELADVEEVGDILNPDDVQNIVNYLKAIEPDMADVFLNH
ncbi:MAG: hypothetical protein K8S55_11675 [Phycisphaerae bacterium]|nr:hypothetical protein [Phycisphaerae bacterium]